jgi:hypothetical protein
MCFVWRMPGFSTRVCLPVYGAFGCYLVMATVLLRHVAGPWILLRRCTARCRPHSHVMGGGQPRYAWVVNLCVPPSISCFYMVYGAFRCYLVTATVLLRHVAERWILLRRCTARCRPHSHVMGYTRDLWNTWKSWEYEAPLPNHLPGAYTSLRSNTSIKFGHYARPSCTARNTAGVTEVPAQPIHTQT